MHVIVFFILVITLSRLFVNRSKNNHLIVIAAFLLILIGSLRSAHFGPDAIRYAHNFNALSHTSLSDLLNQFFKLEGKDPFFQVCAKIISLIGLSYQVWFSIIAAAFTISISRIIKKYSNEPYLSFILLIALGYFFFSMTGLRQTLAISLTLLSFPYILEKKIKQFLFLTIMASLFHSSALIFVIAYPLSTLKMKNFDIIIICTAFVLATFFSSEIRTLIRIFGWTETLAGYADREVSANYTLFLLQLSIFFFCSFFARKSYISNITFRVLFNFLIIGIIFQAFALIVAEFFRVSIYFSIFSIILVPNVIQLQKIKSTRSLVYFSVLFTFVYIIFFLKSFENYAFFWQVPL
jgi:hypothetical protein